VVSTKPLLYSYIYKCLGAIWYRTLGTFCDLLLPSLALRTPALPTLLLWILDFPFRYSIPGRPCGSSPDNDHASPGYLIFHFDSRVFVLPSPPTESPGVSLFLRCNKEVAQNVSDWVRGFFFHFVGNSPPLRLLLSYHPQREKCGPSFSGRR